MENRLDDKQALLSQLPQVSRVLKHADVAPFLSQFSHEFVVHSVQSEIDAYRAQLLNFAGDKLPSKNPLDSIAKQVAARIGRMQRPSLRKVINATGVILHTGLGRAPLSADAQANLSQVVAGSCNIEIDLNTGLRGERTTHVEELLCFLTGSEAACVVNNNAAAVLLVLNTLAFQKETIVSRGQLVEIGGAFRIPEVMEKSGTKMVEVGTTNKTHLRDYEQALTAATGLVCVVHTSNYRVQGFTKEVGLGELSHLAGEKGVPLMQDLGGGILVDLQQFGLPHEPVARESIAAGVDIVTFSGDKVLGGPQCGIIIGKKKCVELIRRNPLMRALRCDKLVYAVLEPTLKQFITKDGLTKTNSVLRMLLQLEKNLAERAQRILHALTALNGKNMTIAIENTTAEMGSGAMPLEEIPSKAVSISVKTMSIRVLAQKFREFTPAIVGYVRDERLFLDLRTVYADDDNTLISAVKQILKS